MNEYIQWKNLTNKMEIIKRMHTGYVEWLKLK